jgi:hypothetical protein
VGASGDASAGGGEESGAAPRRIIPHDTSGFSLPPAESYSVARHFVTLADLDPAERRDARHVCAAAGVVDPALLDACTIDVAVLGDAAMAAPYRNMPAPRLVLKPASNENIDTPSLPAVEQHACAAGPMRRPTSRMWLPLMAALASIRLAIRRRRR